MHFRASKSIFDEYVDDFVKFFFNPQPVLNFRFDIAEHVKQLAGSVLTFIHFHNFDNYLLNSIVVTDTLKLNKIFVVNFTLYNWMIQSMMSKHERIVDEPNTSCELTSLQ